MKDKSFFVSTLLVIVVAIVLLPRRADGQPPAEKKAAQSNATVINADFSQGDFAALGWKAEGDWDVFRFPKEVTKNPGAVARLAAHKPNGSLTNTFTEVKNPRQLTLSLEYGWGWGDADQGADSISFMLLDARGNGYIFEVHRCKAKWAVQWAPVASGTPAKDKTWAPEEIDATHASVRDGGGLSRLTVAREADGVWTITGRDWNKGAGATVKFSDATTCSFSQLVLLGTENFDDQVFNHVVLELLPAAKAEATTAIPVADFLNSIGIVTTFPDRGQPLPKTVDMVNYFYHPGSPGLADNKTWNAADPTSTCKVDGLYGNYGVTWGKHFRGYSETELLTLPRVTTETGCTIGGPITEDIQALNLLSLYLDQFNRGWSHTAVYLLRDRTDEGGNQTFGLFQRDYQPRKAAVYLHNLTTILADQGPPASPGQLHYSIPDQPGTAHDLLLQKSDGTFWLVVWSERLKGADEVTVHFHRSYPAVKVYDPTAGTEPIQTPGTADSLKLTLSDHPFIITLAQP